MLHSKGTPLHRDTLAKDAMEMRDQHPEHWKRREKANLPWPFPKEGKSIHFPCLRIWK